MQTSCDVRACGASVSSSQVAPSAAIQTTVRGDVNAGDDRTISSAKPRLRACGNQALAKNPSEQGTLVLSVSIAANGVVTTTAITSNAGLSVESAACMSAVVRRISFNTGTARTVTLTIVQTKQNT